MGNRNTVWPTSTVVRTVPDRLERSDLEMIVVLPWCKNEDDENTDGERHEGGCVDGQRKGLHGKNGNGRICPPYHDECIQRDSQVFWMCVDDRNSKTGTHGEWTKTYQRRVERHREGGSGATAREGKARQSGREVTKRLKSNPEKAQMDVPTASKTMTNSSSSGTTPASSSSSASEAVRTGSHGGDTRPNRVGNNRKADAEHSEDAERVDDG